ncbi:hypothetical protein N9014_00400 [bacterium]|nr:hypothetical protein [bacterium]
MTKARDLASFLGNNTSLNTINNAYVAGTLVPSSSNANMVMNGDFRVYQRNGGTINPTTYQYGIDRWFYSGAQGSNNYYTMGQSTDAPSGFSNSLLITSTTSSSPQSLYYVRTHFEGYDVAHLDYGTSDAKTTTVSFWIKASGAGDYGFILYNSNAPYTNYSTTYTVNVANTWEYKTINIPANTLQVTATGNSDSMRLSFPFGNNSSRASATNAWGTSGDIHTMSGVYDFLGTSGATLQLTGIKWEVGSEATDFQHVPYAEELAKCHRYFFKSSTSATSMADATAPSYTFRGKRYAKHSLPTVMRANPTVTAVQHAANYSGGITANGQHDYVYLAPSSTTDISGTQYWYGGFTADAEL